MAVSKSIMAAGLIAALAVTGCTPTTQTRDGAITGGILGGIFGAVVDDNTGRGAAVGALAGAGLGALLAQQAQDLDAALANDDIIIENTGTELIVRMPDGILFDVDSAAIRAGLQGDLRALAANLQDYPDSTVDVIGHTDSDGSAEYNQDLSARRAAAVAGVLLEAGVAPFRVRSFGRGESEPIATNLTPEGRQQNRRVEVIIRPTA